MAPWAGCMGSTAEDLGTQFGRDSVNLKSRPVIHGKTTHDWQSYEYTFNLAGKSKDVLKDQAAIYLLSIKLVQILKNH